MATATLPAPVQRLRRLARPVVRVVSAAGWVVVVVGALLLIVPAILGLDRYVITGNSMVPAFERGSVVFSRAVPVEDLRVGDVITYRPPPDSGVDHLVTHRITSVEEGEDGRPLFVTKGDANRTDDPWTFQLAADRQNVVEHDLPVLGHLVAFLSDPSKRILLIGVPAGLIALQALKELVGVLLGPSDEHRPDPSEPDIATAAFRPAPTAAVARPGAVAPAATPSPLTAAVSGRSACRYEDVFTCPRGDETACQHEDAGTCARAVASACDDEDLFIRALEDVFV